MSERKDDIIIGLLVVIIVLQVYGLFLGSPAQSADSTGWQDLGVQETTTLPADEGTAATNAAEVKEALGEAVKAADINDDPQSGANVPGRPARAVKAE